MGRALASTGAMLAEAAQGAKVVQGVYEKAEAGRRQRSPVSISQKAARVLPRGGWQVRGWAIHVDGEPRWRRCERRER